MKKEQVKLGQFYLANVSNMRVVIRIDRHNPRGGWFATNLRTDRDLQISTATRLIKVATSQQVTRAITSWD